MLPPPRTSPLLRALDDPTWLPALQSLHVRTHVPPCAAFRACPVPRAPLAPRTLLRCSFSCDRLVVRRERSRFPNLDHWDF